MEYVLSLEEIIRRIVENSNLEIGVIHPSKIIFQDPPYVRVDYILVPAHEAIERILVGIIYDEDYYDEETAILPLIDEDELNRIKETEATIASFTYKRYISLERDGNKNLKRIRKTLKRFDKKRKNRLIGLPPYAMIYLPQESLEFDLELGGYISVEGNVPQPSEEVAVHLYVDPTDKEQLERYWRENQSSLKRILEAQKIVDFDIILPNFYYLIFPEVKKPRFAFLPFIKRRIELYGYDLRKIRSSIKS